MPRTTSLAGPAALGALCALFLAVPVTTVLFHYGNFSEVGVERTAAAVRMFALAFIISMSVLPAGMEVIFLGVNFLGSAWVPLHPFVKTRCTLQHYFLGAQ